MINVETCAEIMNNWWYRFRCCQLAEWARTPL